MFLASLAFQSPSISLDDHDEPPASSIEDREDDPTPAYYWDLSDVDRNVARDSDNGPKGSQKAV